MTIRYLAFGLACLTLSFLGAEEPSSHAQENLEREGVPSGIVNDTVNVITGAYGEACSDAVVAAKEPLVLTRSSTILGRQGSALGCCWNYSHHQLMLVETTEDLRGLGILSSRHGGGMAYISKRKIENCLPTTDLIADVTRKENDGLTNAARGCLEGRSNQKNTHIHVAKAVERAHVVDPDGGMRKFDLTFIKSGFQGLVCSHEQLPSGDSYAYSYNKNKHLTRITAQSASGAPMAWAEIDYQGNKPPMPADGIRTVSLSDGREIRYHCERFGERKYTFVPRQVDRPSAPTLYYDYEAVSKDNCGRRVCKRSSPDSRYLETVYYGKRPQVIDGFCIASQKIHGISTKGRVALQREPAGYDKTPVVTQRFLYHFDKPRKGRAAGRTEVHNALGIRTDYVYSRYQRLSAIHRYDESDKLYATSRYFWGDEKGKDATNLIRQSVEDAQGSTLLEKHYLYDEEGNVLEETFSGNLSGELTGASQETERAITYRSYSKDRFRLPLHVIEPSGRETTNGYLENSDRLSSQLMGADGQIFERSFYSYDDDGCLIEEIHDDGTSDKKDDLSGVEARLIRRVLPRKQSPGFGLPEEISEVYLDLETGEEQLLSRKLYIYSPWGDQDEEIVFDAHGEERYRNVTRHNEKSQVVERQDPLGRVTNYTYDANGNCVEENPTYMSYSFHYSYDYMNRLVKTEQRFLDGRVLCTRKTYDLLGQLSSETDPFGNKTHYSYDSQGHLIEKRLPPCLDHQGELVEPSWGYEYDILGRVTAEIDPEGYRTEKTYTIRGQLSAVYYPDGGMEQKRYDVAGNLIREELRTGLIRTYSYNGYSQLLEKQEWSPEGELLASYSYAYKGARLIRSVDPEGLVTHYRYDAAGRKIAEIQEWPEGERCTLTEYDALGRVARLIEDDGQENLSIKGFCYDVLGQVIEESSESGDGQLLGWAAYTYDAQGNRCSKSVKDARGNLCSSREIYDDLGQLILSEDAEGNRTRIDYVCDHVNSLGQRVLKKSVTDPLGRREISIYDALGRLERSERRDSFGRKIAEQIQRFDSRGLRREWLNAIIVKADEVEDWSCVRFAYNAMGQLIQLVEAVGSDGEKETRTQYNSQGLKSLISKPDAVCLYYNYDSQGRLKELRSSDRSVHYSYSYDRCGRLLKASDLVHGASVERRYGVNGLLLEEDLGEQGSLRFDYDMLGRRTSLQLPDSSSISYGYRSAQLSSIERFDAQGRSLYSHRYLAYDLCGRVLKTQLAGELGELSVSWDALGRQRRLQHNLFVQELPSEGIDAAGNVRLVRTQSMGETSEERYAYDAHNQLSLEEGTFHHSYSHDSLMNRRQQDAVVSEFDGAQRLRSAGDTVYDYDSNGNTVSVRDAEGLCYQLSYDALDRLCRVEKPELWRVDYVYDALHRRLEKRCFQWVGAAWQEDCVQRFLYDGQNEMGAVQEGQISELRVLGIGMTAEIGAAVAMELKGELYVPVHDYRGNVAQLFDSQAQLVQSVRYGAFGEERATTDFFIPWRFSSKRVDEETGFVYFGRRYYRPESGRWLSPDPLGYEDGPNLYAYVHNHPLQSMDAYGLATEPFRDERSLAFADHAIGAFRTVRNMAGRVIELAAKHLLPPFPAREMLERVGLALQGQNLFKARGSMCTPRYISGVVGEPIQPPWVFIISGPGIGNDKDSSLEAARETSAYCGGAQVRYFGLHTKGLLTDILGAVFQRIGLNSGCSRLIAQHLKSTIGCSLDEYGKAYVLCKDHSRGVQHIKGALSILSESYHQNIEVVTLGGPTFISNSKGHLIDARNYSARNDAVSRIFGLADLFRFLPGYDIRFVGSYRGMPGCDHALLGGTYRSVLEYEGTRFCERFLTNGGIQ